MDTSTFKTLMARGLTDDSNDNLVNLMIALLSIVFFGLILVALWIGVRRVKKQRLLSDQALLPQYHDDVKSPRNHRRLTIETKGGLGRTSVVVFKDGQPMLANPQSPPHSPDNVPEIHITFPDEQDDQGRLQSGRVVVVRLSDASSVGLEPLNDEQLPAYEKESKTQFYSIDMNEIGGLKEKDRSSYN
jgi:hypothetical protein